MDGQKSYQNAIVTLNTLQSNAATIEKARKDRNRKPEKNITWMEKLLGVLGVELDALNVVHVSGTKGKGSTCAFTESLLRHLGFRTGFYSSPHLVAVRERIRLNGKPISEELFSRYFWEVYDKLSVAMANDSDGMPPYFKFLTVMCYYVFLKEKVDVAVMEVGIGGAFDSTNVIRNPVVCGVTSLGYDHMPILGNTLAEIAWHKAGIFKPDCPAVTVQQLPEAMTVLQQRAKEIGAPLFVAPNLSEYPNLQGSLKLGLEGDVQSMNASLALHLVSLWMSRKSFEMERNRSGSSTKNFQELGNQTNIPGSKQNEKSRRNSWLENSTILQKENFEESDENCAKELPSFPLLRSHITALENCVWPGRFQTIVFDNVEYFLDGAHTKDSIQLCSEWFRKISTSSIPKKRILLFNSTADRNAEDLLTPLTKCHFDSVLFCPNIVEDSAESKPDLANFMTDRTKQISRCALHEATWKTLVESENPKTTTECLKSVSEALSWISKQSKDENIPVEVLVTGSLHLVGAVLTMLDPTLKNTL